MRAQTTPILDHAPSAKLPRDLSPMLATVASAPFCKPGWIFEIKWDGYRAIAEIDRSAIRIQSRNGNNLSGRFPSLVSHLAQLGRNTVLDGELVVLDDSGVAQFQWLQNYPRYGGQLAYYVFDILHLDGRDLTRWPLLHRKELLRQVIPNTSSHVRYCDHVEMDGVSFFEAIKGQGVEGMVAKDGASLYLPGQRSKRWLKIKVDRRQQAVIAGYKEGEGARKEFGSLVLGVVRDSVFCHIGEVGTGLGDASMSALLDQLKRLAQPNCPFRTRPRISGRVHWVQPTLQCEVKFQSVTADGKLRHPVWLGLCGGNRADPTPMPAQRPAPSRRRTTETITLAGHTLSLSNLGKIYWPRDQITKRELVAYYRDVAPLIQPYLKDRPLSLRRYPDGVEAENFVQKDLSKAPEWVQTASISHDSRARPVNYALCQDEATLVYLANLGCIELHPWHSRSATLDQPDYFVIDLDPDNTPFSQVVDAALAVRAVLHKAGAACWCKTSGMTGLHIYVPLGAKYQYEQASQFAALVTRLVYQQLPSTTSIERDPARRRGLVYLDSMQNRRAQSIASVYAPRAHPAASVSTPLKWSEVKQTLDPTTFTIRSLGKRLSAYGDLWSGVLGPGIDMLDCLNRLQRLLQSRR